MTIAVFALLVCGATYIVTQSAIAAPARMAVADLHPLAEALVYCPACTAFWIGAALSASGYWPAASPHGLPLVDGAIAACGIGALWSTYGPASQWPLERGANDDTTTET